MKVGEAVELLPGPKLQKPLCLRDTGHVSALPSLLLPRIPRLHSVQKIISDS